jgi:hypothetical protein
LLHFSPIPQARTAPPQKQGLDFIFPIKKKLAIAFSIGHGFHEDGDKWNRDLKKIPIPLYIKGLKKDKLENWGLLSRKKQSLNKCITMI